MSNAINRWQRGSHIEAQVRPLIVAVRHMLRASLDGLLTAGQMRQSFQFLEVLMEASAYHLDIVAVDHYLLHSEGDGGKR